MFTEINKYSELAKKVSDKFRCRPEIKAMALGGSASGAGTDSQSDIDLYIFTKSVIPLEFRKKIVQELGFDRADLNLTYWDLGDEWFDADSGIEVDVIYWHDKWISGMIERVMKNHLPSIGYTTCFAQTIRNCITILDDDHWLSDLKDLCKKYPHQLAQNIITHNHPLLRGIIPSYQYQLLKAVKRDDRISIQHRITEMLSSYFDIIFAVNKVFHPGEKRLITHITNSCNNLPDGFNQDINKLLSISQTETDKIPATLNRLLNNLDEWLKKTDFKIETE